ncbi:MAG: hypothetical protein K2M06_09280 [Muribaculaceae bacterium]|nr:hypothetical protein [Muribaculaceae bacterium]
MGQVNHNKYHFTDDGRIYRVNDDGSFTSMGNVEHNSASAKNSHMKPGSISFPRELCFKGQLLKLFNSKIGKLYIYPEEFVFKPHWFNFGSHREQHWSVSDILGYKRKFRIFRAIITSTKTIYFDSWDIKKILLALEERRQAYYINRGMDVPQLKKS